MNSLFKKIIAGFCAISITISCVVPAFATNQTEVTSEFGTFWEQYLKWQYDVSEIFGDNIGGFCKLVAVGLSADLCGKSDDSKHHGYITGPAVTLFGETKYPAKCNLCGQGFSVTDAQISEAYTDAVNQMPASGYDSAGKLLWQPNFMDAVDVDGGTSQYRYFGFYVGVGSYSSVIKSSEPGFVSTDIQKLDGASVSVIGPKISLDLTSTSNSYDVTVKGLMGTTSPTRLCFLAPIAGSYSVVASPFITAQLETGRLTNLFTTTEYSWRPELVNSGNPYGAGGRLWITLYWNDASGEKIFPGYGISLTGGRKHITFSTPIFQITPVASDTTTINNTYNINTRVNNFQGDYYDSVTNNYYNNTTIINETTNNYYDMTTNNYYTMSNWSYDYQSRTYFVTLEDGTTITVQFGDDCLTITNNNVENSYQYVIKNNNNTPSTDPDTPTTCKHDWQETIDVEPTCLEGGHASFTCSLCGETYEQILSAKGHNWTVADHVNTVYGESGEIITQGHTLYECSTCGEQWYTETAAPPPDVSGGSSIRSWLQAFQLWLDGKLDSLFSAADAVIVTKLDALIEKTSDTIVNVIEDDTYVPSVLYLDDDNGVVDATKNGVSIFGDLLRWLWENVFDGAFEAADITKLDGLFYDPTEVTTDGS